MATSNNIVSSDVNYGITIKYPKKYSFYSKNQHSSFKLDSLESFISSPSSHLNSAVSEHINSTVSESSVFQLVSDDISVSSPLISQFNDVQTTEKVVSNEDFSTFEFPTDHTSFATLSSYYKSIGNEDLCEPSTNENNLHISQTDGNYWCSECNKMYDTLNCPKHPVLNVTDKAVQSMARATLPSILALKRVKQQTNTIPDLSDTEYGIFSRNHLPCRVRFGPLKGVLINKEATATALTNNSKESFILSLSENDCGSFVQLTMDDENTSNWTRFIRPAVKYEVQNLVVDQHGPNLYYTTTKIIKPKEELRVWYGMEYAMKRKLLLLLGDPFYRDVRMFVKYGIRPSIHSQQESEECSNEEQFENFDCNSVKENQKHSAENLKKKTKKTPKCDYKITKTRYGRIVKTRYQENEVDSLLVNRNIYSCKVCYLPFDNKALLKCHAIVHRGSVSSSNVTQDDEVSSSEYSCPKCESKFMDAHSLAQHVEMHSLEKEYEADNYRSSTTSGRSKNKEDDISKMKEERKVWCHICRGIFLGNHWRIHKVKKTYTCILCNKSEMQKKELRLHFKEHKANSGLFHCPSCSKVTERYTLMYKHITHCHGEFKTCHHCGRQFRDRHKLILHILSHMNRKDYLCTVCGKQFNRADKLSAHTKNVHTSKREELKLEKIAQIKEKKEQKDRLKYETLRYKCHTCRTGYRLLNSFVNHFGSVHPSVDVKSLPQLALTNKESGNQQSPVSHQCELCLRRYSKRSNLLMHQRKKHKDLVGNNKSKSASDDNTNANNRCQWCSKCYSKHGNLLAHQRKKHKELLPEHILVKRKSNTVSVNNQRNFNIGIIGNDMGNAAQLVNVFADVQSPSTIQIVQEGTQLTDMNEEIEFTATIDAEVLVALKQSLKNSTAELVDINHVVEEEGQRSTPNTEQYLQCLKLLSSSGMVSPTNEHTEGTFSVINVDNNILLQQILSAYPFISQ